LPQNDSLRYIEVLNLGHNSKKVLKSNDLIINLSPKVYELNEVVVIAKQNTQELVLGKQKKRNILIFYYYFKSIIIIIVVMSIS
jgi:hypothetical protein